MSTMDDQLAELEDTILHGDHHAALDAAEELLAAVREAGRGGSDIGDEWALKAILYLAMSVADASHAERAANQFATALQLHSRHYGFLAGAAERDSRVRVLLAALLNDVAWAHVEYGDIRQARKVNKEATGILARMVEDRDAMALLAEEGPIGPAYVFNELGSAYYTASSLEGIRGKHGRALELGERAADTSARAAELDTTYRGQHHAILDSFLRNMNTFGGWFEKRRIRKKYG